SKAQVGATPIDSALNGGDGHGASLLDDVYRFTEVQGTGRLGVGERRNVVATAEVFSTRDEAQCQNALIGVDGGHVPANFRQIIQRQPVGVIGLAERDGGNAVLHLQFWQPRLNKDRKSVV